MPNDKGNALFMKPFKLCCVRNMPCYVSYSDGPYQRSLQGKLPSSARLKSLVFASFPCVSLHIIAKWLVTLLSFILQKNNRCHLVPHVILHLMK